MCYGRNRQGVRRTNKMCGNALLALTHTCMPIIIIIIPVTTVLCTPNLNWHASTILDMLAGAQAGAPMLTWFLPGRRRLHLGRHLDTTDTCILQGIFAHADTCNLVMMTSVIKLPLIYDARPLSSNAPQNQQNPSRLGHFKKIFQTNSSEFINRKYLSWFDTVIRN